MAVWTTPRTWDTGWHVSASDLNSQIRDNLLVLAEGSGVMVEQTQQVSTNSTVISNIGWFAVQFQVRRGGRIKVEFVGNLSMGSSGMTGRGNIYLYLSGAHYQLAQVDNSGVRPNGWVALAYLTQNLAIGTYDVRLRWSVTSSDNTVRCWADANSPARMIVLEV